MFYYCRLLYVREHAATHEAVKSKLLSAGIFAYMLGDFEIFTLDVLQNPTDYYSIDLCEQVCRITGLLVLIYQFHHFRLEIIVKLLMVFVIGEIMRDLQ